MKFRKKPVVIDAIQFNEKDNAPMLAWVQDLTGVSAEKNIDFRDGKHFVKTLEGQMLISNGDYLIRGINGEFYPCKPDIFAKTYDPA